MKSHTEGRALMRAMAEGAPPERMSAAHRYLALLRGHIDKENGILNAETHRALTRDFQTLGADFGREASMDYGDAVLRGLGAIFEGAIASSSAA
jgi:hypothetical protein